MCPSLSELDKKARGRKCTYGGRQTVVKQHAEFVELQAARAFGMESVGAQGVWHGGGQGDAIVFICMSSLKVHLIIYTCISNLDSFKKCVHSGFPFFFFLFSSKAMFLRSIFVAMTII